MMEKISPDQVEQAIKEHNIRSWTLRKCSICHTNLNYTFVGDKVYYNANCNCGRHWEPLLVSSYREVANTFNLQTPEARKEMWDEFIASGSDEPVIVSDVSNPAQPLTMVVLPLFDAEAISTYIDQRLFLCLQRMFGISATQSDIAELTAIIKEMVAVYSNLAK